jgi:hypothetical protein
MGAGAFFSTLTSGRRGPCGGTDMMEQSTWWSGALGTVDQHHGGGDGGWGGGRGPSTAALWIIGLRNVQR